MKDAHNADAESNEKLCIRFFQFLVFELLLVVFTIYGTHQLCHRLKKNCTKVVKLTRNMCIDMAMIF